MKKNRLIAAVSSAAIFAGMLSSFTVSFAAGTTTLTVGANAEYKTIRAAVAQAKAINPQSEAERVTINVDPGDYEEQVRIDNAKYITLQQTPGTEDQGRVDLHWYFCTGYCSSNTDLNGLYDPNIDWSLDETWNGYNAGDEKFTRYEIGQSLDGVSKISYYDKQGVKHKDAAVYSGLGHLGGLGWSYDKMAPLIVTRSSSDITIKDFNLVNSVPVMVTQGERDGHLTPENPYSASNPGGLLDRNMLNLCNEYTEEKRPTADIYSSNGGVDKAKLVKAVKNGLTFSPEESAWLVKSSVFNERGHAIAILGDRIVVENVRVRGNQDSVWVSDGRTYFKNCDLIGGTDYIYGSAAAVFDNCKLGFTGFSDYSYGSPLSTPNTDKSRNYGYLFWNCTIYNVRDNNGVNNLGGPWGADGQCTYYNTTLDNGSTLKYGKSKAVIDPKGWGRFGAENGLSRVYEYGTKNGDGTAADLSKRIVNKSVEEGGYGMGTVLDQWQILEFNPRNVFGKANNFSDDWDPMNFNAQMTSVDTAIASAEVVIPAGEATSIDLPQAPSGITYKWVSASSNAVVSADGKKLNVVRPAVGEDAINTMVTLYAMDNNKKIGDKKDVAVTINPTTDTTNVFNIPVKIEQSTNAKNTYTVTITKNGALIKTAEIDITGGDNTAEATITGVPANAAGIDYDVKIVSKSDAFAVTAPEDGKTTIKGITGKDVELNITAQKLVDASVALDITAAASGGNKTYDLIALAKAAGATDEILTSDTITVQFDVPVDAAMSKDSFIDISSGTPSNSNGAVAARFAMFRLKASWYQIDAVSNAQGFSGASNGKDQCLNITGKNIYPAKNTVRAIINYKDGTITVDGDNNGGSGQSSVPYTFESFPENVEKGKVNMGLFVGSTSDKFTLSNVKVIYKAVITGDEPEPTPTSKPTDMVYNFRPGDNAYINTTNSSSSDPRGSLDGSDYDIEGDGSIVFSKDCYWSGTDHGVVVWGGDNKIKIKVDGSTEVTIGGCAFSSASNVTFKADGNEVETQAYAKNCWQGTTAADNVNTFTYKGGAAELTVVFDGYVYLPMLEVKKLDIEVETPEPQPTEVVYDLRANDNAYINTTNSSSSDPRGSVDGNAYDFEGDGKVVFSNDCYQSGTSHGAVVWGGDNKIKIKVDGPTEITVGGCAFSSASNVTLKANSNEVETQAYAKNCWQGTTTADNVNTFTYKGGAAELTVVFDGYVYLPMLGIKSIEAEVVTPEPEVIPEGEGVYDFAGRTSNFDNKGNQCTDSNEYKFVDGVDAMAKYFFADINDSSKVKSELTANYMNYIGGTNTDAHPSIKLTMPAGKYKVYYLGYNSGKNVTAAIGDKVFTAKAGVNFAQSSSKTLKLYEIDIEYGKSAEGTYLTFNSTDAWLPDLYSVVIVGTESLIPAPTVTVEKVAESANEGSAAAAAYTGTFDNNGYKASAIKWTVNGDKESKMDISITGESTVIFGLVVTAENLEDIKSVTAVVE